MAQLVKNPPATWETWVRSLGWEDPLAKRMGYPLQYSGLENSMDWRVQGVAESDMTEQLSLSLVKASGGWAGPGRLGRVPKGHT